MIGVRKDGDPIILVALGSDLNVDGEDFALGDGGFGFVMLWWVGGVHDTDATRCAVIILDSPPVILILHFSGVQDFINYFIRSNFSTGIIVRVVRSQYCYFSNKKLICIQRSGIEKLI